MLTNKHNDMAMILIKIDMRGFHPDEAQDTHNDMAMILIKIDTASYSMLTNKYNKMLR